jgi:hypothetical protein
MTAREHKRCQAENLRRPRTLLADAFLRALQVWALRHSGDDNSPITPPVGTVTTGELVKVITALIVARGREPARSRS